MRERSGSVPAIPERAMSAAEAMRSRVGRNVTQEQVARRAYEIYMARGAQPGRHEEDWYQAERELKERSH